MITGEPGVNNFGLEQAYSWEGKGVDSRPCQLPFSLLSFWPCIKSLHFFVFLMIYMCLFCPQGDEPICGSGFYFHKQHMFKGSC